VLETEIDIHHLVAKRTTKLRCTLEGLDAFRIHPGVIKCAPLHGDTDQAGPCRNGLGERSRRALGKIRRAGIRTARHVEKECAISDRSRDHVR
jgi:hypothetical protein